MPAPLSWIAVEGQKRQVKPALTLLSWWCCDSSPP